MLLIFNDSAVLGFAKLSLIRQIIKSGLTEDFPQINTDEFRRFMQMSSADLRSEEDSRRFAQIFFRR